MKRLPFNQVAALFSIGLFCVVFGGQSKLCIDNDLDGYYVPTCGSECGLIDCDDSDVDINPGIVEASSGDLLCTDGIDNDCDGLIDIEDNGCQQGISWLPDTGISLCYDHTQEIDCPELGEPFYGQDAQYVSNPMSFTFSGDGTVTDNVTGIIWQQEDDGIARRWWEAMDYCEALDLADNTEWRLPNEYELQSIVDYGHFNPSVDSTIFFGTKSDYYWSSSIYAQWDDWAWQGSFDNGFFRSNEMTERAYVRCVCGDSINQNLTDNGDGTVSDDTSGLMWQKVDDDIYQNWEEALTYCENSVLAGYADWRLPDIKEIKSLVDNNEFGPAINTTYFPTVTNAYYWSSSTYPSIVSRAYHISFLGGGIAEYSKTGTMFTKCVR